MEAYLKAQEIANDKLDSSAAMIIRIQFAFSDEWDFEISDENTRTGKKLEKAGDVFKYYNPVYLIFFKCYKQEMYLMEAISAGDVNAIEQNRTSLLQFAEQGLAELKEIKSYKGDNSLKMACYQAMKYYVKEAEDYIPDITNFFLAKEEFDEIKDAFDEIRERDRTERDINAYNEAINEYNEAVEKYQLTIKILNKKMKELYKDWNKDASKFLKKNIPRR